VCSTDIRTAPFLAVTWLLGAPRLWFPPEDPAKGCPPQGQIKGWWAATGAFLPLPTSVACELSEETFYGNA